MRRLRTYHHHLAGQLGVDGRGLAVTVLGAAQLAKDLGVTGASTV
jgi:hypothetical protein